MANLLSTTVNGNVLVGPSGTANAYDGAATGKLYFGNQVSDSPTHYHITTNMENFGGSYSKLDIRWYTGQRFYAHYAYGGFRFKEITTGNNLFSIGEGDVHVRVNNNLYIAGNLAIHAGNIGSQSVSYAASAGSAGTVTGSSTIDGYLTLNTNWGVSPYTAAFNIVGTYPSMVFRGSNGDTHYLIHMDSNGDIQYYFGPGYTTNNWTQRYTFTKGGNFSVLTGNISASGTISASNFSGSSSGTNTGDQTNISGNSATTSQRDFSGDISTSGQGRFAGWYTGNAQTGLAAEIGTSGGQVYIIAYKAELTEL